MDRCTQLALNRINQRFYAAIAHEWTDKRRHAWPGFDRLWRTSCAARPVGLNCHLSVLDVGCGDGRFAQFIAEQEDLQARAGALTYVGIDDNAALLERARARQIGSAFHFHSADFVATPIDSCLGTQTFDLIVLLGVLHHIPGHEQRAQLLRALGEHLNPRGQLAVTVWRLDEDPRFASRVVSFEAYNQHAAEAIALNQLEPGDTLLRWGGRATQPRYCHFPDAAELQRLIEKSGLVERVRFRADGHQGRLNEYLSLEHR